jgi:hypothetical protein
MITNLTFRRDAAAAKHQTIICNGQMEELFTSAIRKAQEQ